MSYAYRHSVRGLWKDNHASYHFHTPVEYDVVAANKYKFLNADLAKFKLKNWREVVNTFVDYNIGDREHLIRVKTLYLGKSTHFNNKENNFLMSDYAFWIPRRLIRRGPNSWSRTENRRIHKETVEKCLYRAIINNNPMYQSPGWGGW